ncbi:Der GTPase-activating protein YihI [Gayadomonas joobiniege]|uniref:Der GTPase-activating protein YihI n=1 Tax=Gayadomonas joobiniege TaxID=1234606 RepID=UPI00037C455B|nr:Der GTPase-activating protein YihI [Gayadomonas joobiniege]
MKKSRKPGAIGVAKSDKGKPLDKQAKKSQQRKGQKSGSRHSVTQNTNAQATSDNKKDPRVGSKKPVPLTVPVAKPEPEKTEAPKPQASVKKASKKEDKSTQYWQELEQIEADPRLQSILDKLDNEEQLDAQALAYFNKQQDRHAWLTEKLGISDETLDEDEALLDAFENSYPKE